MLIIMILFNLLYVKYEADIYINITLRVGKVIDVEEFDSSKKQSYVLIRTIITL